MLRGRFAHKIRFSVVAHGIVRWGLVWFVKGLSQPQIMDCFGMVRWSGLGYGRVLSGFMRNGGER